VLLSMDELDFWQAVKTAEAAIKTIHNREKK